MQAVNMPPRLALAASSKEVAQSVHDDPKTVQAHQVAASKPGQEKPAATRTGHEASDAEKIAAAKRKKEEQHRLAKAEH
jgi:hypothetical protein